MVAEMLWLLVIGYWSHWEVRLGVRGDVGFGHGYDVTQLWDESTSMWKVSRCLPVKPVQALKPRKRGREINRKKRGGGRIRNVKVQGKIGREKVKNRTGNFWILRSKKDKGREGKKYPCFVFKLKLCVKPLQTLSREEGKGNEKNPRRM